MGDKDLIFRGDVVKGVVNVMEKYFGTSSMIGVVNAVKHYLTVLPAAPHEMSAVEFFEEFQRMCLTVDGCSDCPIMGMEKCEGYPCRYRAYQDTDKAVAIVERWAAEHPEERSEEDE